MITLYAFYVGFALSISVYRQWLKGALNIYNKIVFAPILIAFFLLDVGMNYTALSLLFGFPPIGAFTISARLEIYHKTSNASAFQKAFATFVCEKLLNPIDPTGDHC